MGAIALWFIMTNATGYRAPLDITDFSVCNHAGAVVGIQVDSLENPQLVTFPAPGDPSKHCRVDVGEHVAGLPEGEWHFATTEMGDGSSKPWSHIDPHTTVYWIKSNAPNGRPPKPAGFRLIGGQQ